LQDICGYLKYTKGVEKWSFWMLAVDYLFNGAQPHFFDDLSCEELKYNHE
jgi:hypothetical protein